MSCMSLQLRIWHATLGRFFEWIDSAIEQRRIRESFSHPIIKRAGRETLMYYESGRSTAITCDLALGCRDLDLLIFKKAPLKWLDTGEPLTPQESERVFQKVAEHLDKMKIRWKFSEASSNN